MNLLGSHSRDGSSASPRKVRTLAHLRHLGGRSVWNRAELLHHRERVEDAPVLVGEAVVANADDVDRLHRHALVGGRHAHELARVRSGAANATDDLVAAGEDVPRPRKADPGTRPCTT
jgi:hypothetical protein